MARGERVRVLGADGAPTALLLAHALDTLDGPLVHLVADDAAVRRVVGDVRFFAGPHRDRVFSLPEPDVSPYADMSPDPRSVGARLAALYRLRHGGEPMLMVTSVRAWSQRTIPRDVFEAGCARFCAGEDVERDAVIKRLVAAGFVRTEVVEDPGTFAIRGAVMDLYPPADSFPARLEWFGDEIERIRRFDPASQRSLGDRPEVVVHPVRETVHSSTQPLRERIYALADGVNAPTRQTRAVLENLQRGVDFFGVDALVPALHDSLANPWEYAPDGAQFVLTDPDALASLAAHHAEETRTNYDRCVAEHRLVARPEDFFVGVDELKTWMDRCGVVMSNVESPASEDRAPIRVEVTHNPKLRVALEAARGRQGGELLRPIADHIRHLDQGPGPWRAILVAPNHSHAERLAGLLRGYQVDVGLHGKDDDPGLTEAPDRGGTRVEVRVGRLSEGFASEHDRLFLLSEQEIFGRIAPRRKSRTGRPVGVGGLAQLAVGDYVVHVMHGVGRYVGLMKLTLRGVAGDFVQLEYAATDKLYLPVYRLGEIERYASAAQKPPKLDRMGGATFATKTGKVKASVRQLAEELLQIYAQREASDGYAFPEADDLYAEFESTFPFEETPDQEAAIDAVNKDLGRPRPMDRLVCGDVGFGKTEVALRAAFRVATSGRQVAVLAPTTVLVQQHYRTFAERLERFGVKVGSLNRFVKTAERRRVLEQVRTGSIDVLIGTHRILSRDVRFRDLGLVVIDEEQRFGVAQKERFKRLKTQVDVLILTATPIPRTLHMSLLGIREISLIVTPPADRLAVRSFLTRIGDAVIEKGIRKEMARGGQIFYVVPKITGIDEHARRIRELVPDAKVLVAHGQMPGDMLERAMLDFVEHRADVLVSTTIIESGLDIPRANTMFVARADMFGLAQLYQLRGRIGRSRHRAYCYFMVSSLEQLSPQARKRLEAVVRHSELGSGFNVASQDLEIRGAGELLGARQSGSIQAIGFEAYARILEEAVAELRGHPIPRETDPEIAVDVPAFLPDTYVEDVSQRLELYRRLSTATSVDEIRDVMAEIRDRFGPPPLEARCLGEVMAWRVYGRKLRATALELDGRRMSVRRGPETPWPGSYPAGLATESGRRYRRMGSDRVATTLPEDENPVGRLKSGTAALADLVADLRDRRILRGGTE